jgi:ABC-type transport system involved in Fe-S cluster assembly fused permease/ATPase subunit
MTGSKGPTRAKPVRDESLLATFARLWPHLWPHDRPDLQRRIGVAFALLFVAKLITVATPYTYKWATDALTALAGGNVTADDTSVLAPLLAAPVLLTLAYGAGRILMVLVTQLRDGLFAAVAMHAVRRLALRTFQHVHRLSLRFHLERKTGALSRIVERGRDGIETLTRTALLTAAPTIVELVLVLGLVWWTFDVRYVLIVLGTVIAYTWFTLIASEWRIAIRKQMNDQDTDATAKAIDSLLNAETVKYFGNADREAARFDRAMAGYETAAVRSYTSLAWLNAGQAVIFTIGMTAAMVLVIPDIRDGRNTVGDFVMINAIMLQLYMPLNFLGFVYREIKQAVVDIEAMFRLLAREPEIVDAPGARPLAVAGGTVRFEDVRFAYDPARQILRGVSFEVPAGRTVAIVGPSGAGKSTIARLLFRFYDITGGRISIDGQDIREVTQASLREAIGVVPQDTVLFNDTIRYNIRYGRWEASDAEVEEAARLAQIDGFIALLPDGYDTEVGERGLKLSGGEKQRVAIARTLLKGPPILILDEATSALDSHTEKEIQDALETVSRGRTTLVIAHRLTTIVGADEILVLDAGRLVERGTHTELLAAGGLYASLWTRQREADEAREKLAAAGEDGSPRALPGTADMGDDDGAAAAREAAVAAAEI